ncbi:hypothetical protein V8G54_026604 [Vigna mungo]|uniref:TFIIS-type domain-containing protein n=1 Tax=Vigna mungo TaxID=3915 RepID=A0AAQ3N0V2_VIGMU
MQGKGRKERDGKGKIDLVSKVTIACSLRSAHRITSSFTLAKSEEATLPAEAKAQSLELVADCRIPRFDSEFLKVRSFHELWKILIDLQWFLSWLQIEGVEIRRELGMEIIEEQKVQLSKMRSADEGQTTFYTCTRCGHQSQEN